VFGKKKGILFFFFFFNLPENSPEFDRKVAAGGREWRLLAADGGGCWWQ
jgi:hypothetical protein